MIECDVAIVGAGPAGCAAARECTRKGLKTVIVEKKKIPRHKACSGILVPDSINALSEHFGDVPQDVLAVPSHIHAMRMHFPGGYRGDIPIHGLMIRRDRFDAWLCKASQADVLDQTKMQSFSERGDGVDLFCVKSNGEPLHVHSQIMIAADGGASRMVKQIDPPLTDKLTWYVALQETYACKCHLEPGLFHLFAFPEISLYPSAYVKDDLLVMEVVFRLEDKDTLAMSRFKEHLWKRIGIEQAHLVRRLGCRRLLHIIFHIIFLDNRKKAPLYFLRSQAMPDKGALGKQDRSMTEIRVRKQQGDWKMKSNRLIRLLAAAVGIAIFISVPAWANKSETVIDVPDSAVKGSEITIKLTVTHNANNFFHYTDWLWVQVNGKEVGRWDFGSKKPEGSAFTREIKVKVEGDLDIKAKANCNMHGSANEAAAKVTVK